jgi:hypothetical protein
MLLIRIISLFKLFWYLVLFVETPRKFITAVINLRDVSTNKTIYFIAMQTYKELIILVLYKTNNECSLVQ